MGGRVRLQLTAHDMLRLRTKYQSEGAPTMNPALFRSWCFSVGVFACDLALVSRPEFLDPETY